MSVDRYEEYVRFSDGIPFVFHDRLERNESSVRREANWHENLELQLCERGSGSVLLAGERIPFCEGDVVAVNSGVIHRTETDRFLVYSCIIFDSAFCARAGIEIKHVHFAGKIKGDAIAPIFASIRNTYADERTPCRTARMQALALALLIELRENHTVEYDIRKEGTYSNVKNAISYIRMHFHEKISLEEVARGIYANKYVLSRQFKAITGQTVVDYIHAYRCTRAAQLLKSGTSVAEAALSCGYRNLSFFAKCFYKHMGALPRDWKC